MPQDFLSIIAEYHAGLEAELTLLRQLESLASRHRLATFDADLETLHDIHVARERVMTGLVGLEHDLKDLRAQLTEHHQRLVDVPEFQAVAALHTEAAAMVTRIISSDQETLTALREAETARRAAACVMEQAETTLHAYRRVVAPPATNASLVDRRG